MVTSRFRKGSLSWLVVTCLGIGFYGVSPSYGEDIHQAEPDPNFASVPYDPPNRGAPGQTRDAGSRPLCEQPAKPYTAIAPSVNWGETTESHPTFWLYVPYQAGDLELFLREEQTQTEIYRTTFAAPEAGIHAVTLPADAPPLEPGTVYNWQIDFICNPESRSKFRVAGMVIRREESPQLDEALAGKSPREQAIVFAENGLWYDALNIVATLHGDYPEDDQLTQDWESLLRHPIVGLDDLVDEPIVD